MSGVALENIWSGLSFPTSLIVGDDGALVVAESGLPFGGNPPGGRVLRREGHGDASGTAVVARDLPPPVNGVLQVAGGFVVSVGGQPSRLVRAEANDSLHTLVDGFPGPGNYHLNMAVAGPDERLYFGVGAMTNTGVVGPDGLSIGWLRQLRHAHDVPGVDIELRGRNFAAADPDSGDEVLTGAFRPFGVATHEGEFIEAGLPATASVLRCEADGTGLELVAWGIRNAYGLGFLADGRLLAIDQGADDRGSRPVGGVGDFLFEVRTGSWYGWPDFMGGIPITDPRFTPSRGEAPDFVLADHHALPPPEPALVTFPPHSAATRFVQIPADAPRHGGHLLVTLFGDERPMTAPNGPRVGRDVVRVDPEDWSVHAVRMEGMRRPIDLAVDGATGSILFLDFGSFEMGAGGTLTAERGSGAVWRCSLEALASE